MNKFYTLALSAALLAGCAIRPDINWDNAEKLKVGMTEQEALALMGNPYLSRSSESGTAHIWISRSGIFTLDTRVKDIGIRVQNGVVVEVSPLHNNRYFY